MDSYDSYKELLDEMTDEEQAAYSRQKSGHGLLRMAEADVIVTDGRSSGQEALSALLARQDQNGASTAMTRPGAMRTERSSQRAVLSCGLASGRRR